mmetsp:Transcript_69414/g.130554  ORF Transcript_69414/g.130554 Transcript_69414/m.130554 type:complete len:381 (+) Transcript_69414:133-1275(+)
MLATVLLLTTLPIVVGGGLVAGNLMLDLNARNDILYEQLRQSLSIDILEDVFSNNEKVPPPLTMHTADGERYVCSLPDLDGFDENDDDTASSSNDAASATAVHPAERMESIMKTLEGRCDTLNVGWWSYEWCHRRHVRQFHVDHASGKVDPVWSLGHYTRTDLKISATTDSASSSGDASSDPPAYLPTPPQPAASVVTSVVDLFEAGGQHCDEIGKGRQTRIEFRCCTDASSPVDASPAPSSSRSLVAAAAAAAAMAAAVDPNDNSRTAQRKRKNAALTAAAAAAAVHTSGAAAITIGVVPLLLLLEVGPQVQGAGDDTHGGPEPSERVGDGRERERVGLIVALLLARCRRCKAGGHRIQGIENHLLVSEHKVVGYGDEF